MYSKGAKKILQQIGEGKTLEKGEQNLRRYCLKILCSLCTRTKGYKSNFHFHHRQQLFTVPSLFVEIFSDKTFWGVIVIALQHIFEIQNLGGTREVVQKKVHQT